MHNAALTRAAIVASAGMGAGDVWVDDPNSDIRLTGSNITENPYARKDDDVVTVVRPLNEINRLRKLAAKSKKAKKAAKQARKRNRR